MVEADSFLCESCKVLFDAILCIDLEKGTYTELSTSSGEKAYSEIPLKLKDGRLSLPLVRRELASHERYDLFCAVGHGKERKCTFLLAPDKAHAMLFISDFSDVAAHFKKKLHAVRKERDRDFVSGLSNRNFYEKYLKSQQVTGCVAIIDIDDFKLCNDAYGHDAGDEALRVIAKTVEACIASGDTLLRYGGDEFLLIAPGVSAEDAEVLLERIRLAVHSISTPRPLSVSIGSVDARNEVLSEAIYRADRMMYLAKERGDRVMTEQKLAILAAERPDETRSLVLVVDDSAFNRELLKELLADTFDVLEAESGKECLRLLSQHGQRISALLLDVQMPGMSGFEVLEEMGKRGMLEEVPAIIITVDDSLDAIRRAYALGASDYIRRPFDSEVLTRRIRNTVGLYAKQRKLLSLLAEEAREKQKGNRMAINVLINVVGSLNGESSSHMRNIQKISALLLERLLSKTGRYGLSSHDCQRIATCACLHDIGLIGVRPEILNKKGKLTPDEFAQMKRHTILGEKMLCEGELSLCQSDPLVCFAKQICRWHHERYDASGYPDGLKGDDIPIAAQVVSIADAYDTLVGGRSYKMACSLAKAVEMIKRGECGLFNPLLVSSLEEIADKLALEVYGKGEGCP